ncbi:MAG: DUF47 family protein [bacterium]
MAVLFRHTKELETQIDGFFDAISEGALVFKQGVASYLDGDREQFEERLAAVSTLENEADKLRRSVENQLYRHSLIPEHRGDVLGLLETMDNVIDSAKDALLHFSVESPTIPTALNPHFLELANTAAEATEAVVLAARAFFHDVRSVSNHLHKVYFHEKEADKIAVRLRREAFSAELDLSHKIHLRDFADLVDTVADMAEDVADRLTIYSIKRSP